MNKKQFATAVHAWFETLPQEKLDKAERYLAAALDETRTADGPDLDKALKTAKKLVSEGS